MKNNDKPREQLLKELEKSNKRIAELEKSETERKLAKDVLYHRVEELAALLKASHALNAKLGMETVLQATTDIAIDLIGIESAAIYLLEGEELYLGATTPQLDPQMPESFRRTLLVDHPHLQKSVSTGLPVILADTATADLTPAERTISEARGLRTIFYVPILIGKRVIGTLIFGTIGKPRAISEAEIDLCRTMANLVAVSIRNANLYENLMQHSKELKNEIGIRKRAEEKIQHLNLVLCAIRNVNQLIIEEKNRDVLIQKVCKILIENRGYGNAWIVLLGEQGEYIDSVEAGLGKDFTPMKKMLEEGKMTDCGNKTLKKKDVVIIEDPGKECADCPLSANYAGRGGYSMCISHGDNIYGLLTVSVPVIFIKDKEEQDLFREVSGDIGIALYSIEVEKKRKQAEEELIKHREQLEELVKERTVELEEKNKELKRYNRLFEGRELRIKELRDKVKELEGKK